jgi:hypothetical protein
VAIALIKVALLVAVAALTIGVGVAWAATRGSSTPSTTTPSTTPSATAPHAAAHNDGNCPHMGAHAGSSSSTAYARSM